jgi:hypothetical protein
MVASPGRTEPSTHHAYDADATDAYKQIGDSDSVSVSASNKGDDSSSVMSTSSRSFFRAPSLRRRVTDRTTAEGFRNAGTGTGTGRRASEAKSEEEAAALGLQIELGMQGQGKEGQWGIGDEARMGLE